MANDYNEITNRLHSTREAADESVNHIVSGADEIYDDVAPYRVNGHIECNEVTPVGTENPVELGWYEKIYDTQDPTLFEWELSEDTTVDEEKEYGLPKGAKQSDINNQLYTMVGDITGVTITPSGEVISPDENKIIDKEDGYIPTAGAVGRALGANFEDNLQSTSTVKGLTANMGRVLNENKADINGYYETMGAGYAKNLDGDTINSEAYLIRPTGGDSNEVANGVASVLGMEGNSAAWNQLVQNGDFSNGTTNWNIRQGSEAVVSTTNGILTCKAVSTVNTSAHIRQDDFNFITDHLYNIRVGHMQTGGTKFNIVACDNSYSQLGIIIQETPVLNTWYYTTMKYKPSINHNSLLFGFSRMNNDNNEYYSISNVQVFDLTLMGIDNLTTAQVEAWLAQHVGTKPYYAYNPGTILSAQTIGIKTYGQNLFNPTRQAKLIPYTWVEDGTTYSNQYTIKNVPSGVTATFTPDNTGVAVTVDISGGSLDITSYGSGILELSAATADTYVCMKWNTDKDNDVVPYEDHTYNFDVTKVYGKINGEGEYVQCFPDGMRCAVNAHDTLSASEAVSNVGYISDLGSLDWSVYYSAYPTIYVAATAHGGKSTTLNGINTAGYKMSNASQWYYTPNKCIRMDYSGGVISIIINDTNFTDAATCKAALSGVIFYYELATPITYTDLIYRDGGVDRPLREVLVNLNVDNWSMEEQLMTDYDNQGNPTSVPATIQTKYSIDAVEAIKTLEEITYTETEVRTIFGNLLTCLNGEFSEDLGGTFVIKDNVPPTPKVFDFEFVENASTNSTEENTETI